MTQVPLLLIGYWVESELGGLPSIWPDPRHLVMAWDEQQQRNVVEYLESGHVLFQYMGYSWCRFRCVGKYGSKELSDGTYVWPEALGHYVSQHSVALPESFLRHLEASSFVMPHFAAPLERPAVSDAEFLRWAAGRAPKPPERSGTASLAEARSLAAKLSTSRTPFTIEDYNGRWHVVGGRVDAYYAPLTLAELTAVLRPERAPDTLIDGETATKIAARSCGPNLTVTFEDRGSRSWKIRVWLSSEQPRYADVHGRTDALGVELLIEELNRNINRDFYEILELVLFR